MALRLENTCHKQHSILTVVRKLLQRYFTAEVVKDTTNKNDQRGSSSAKQMGVVLQIEARKNINAYRMDRAQLLLSAVCTVSPPLMFTSSGGGGATSCSIVCTTTAASTLCAAASQVHLYRKRCCCANLEIHVEELGGRTCFFTEVTK